MSTTLFLRGELRIKPGHEGAVDALRDLILPEDYSGWALNGNVLSFEIDEDVSHRHYQSAWDGLAAFVDDHCETAAAIQTGPSERDVVLFGSDEAKREAAFIEYCNNELAYWETMRTNARKESQL